MAPYHILIVIISSVIPENLVLLTKSEQSGPKSAHIRPTKRRCIADLLKLVLGIGQMRTGNLLFGGL